MKTIEDYEEELNYLYKKQIYEGSMEWVEERIEEVLDILKGAKNESF
jgi:hypothetical protein